MNEQNATIVAEGTFNTEGAETNKALESTGAAAETKQETKPEANAEAKPEAKDDRFSAKFAALTRKEKEIKAREKAVAAEKAELQKRIAELEERSKGQKTLEDQLKENPLKVIKEKAGYDFEKLAELQLNDENPTTDMQIQRAMEKVKADLAQSYEEKIKKLEERLETQDKQKLDEEKRKEQEKYENTVNGFKTQIRDTVQKEVEKYELVNSRGQEGIDMVFEVMQNVYLETTRKDEDGNVLIDEKTGMPLQPGKIIDVVEAIAEVERELEEHAKKILELKKFRPKTSQDAKSDKDQKGDSPTLSNTHSSEVPRNGMKRMSDEESKAEAAKMIRWFE